MIFKFLMGKIYAGFNKIKKMDKNVVLEDMDIVHVIIKIIKWLFLEVKKDF